MSILRRISMDGTFNQNKPLLNLIPAKHCFSFDLKSATDRFPLSFLCKIMQCMFGCDFASSVVNSTLAFNFFHVPFVKRKSSTVCFVAGQPLGYYSSWPLFSLAHHILIWWCADQVKPGIKFRQYAVLGDDVLITDPDVAKVYEKSLSDLGVAINYQKSLISDCGAAEFGKRFRYDMLKEDLSPISIRSLLNSYHPFGLVAIADKYNIKRFSTLARIGGAGFKTTHTSEGV
ncbi:hypothetical protein VSDG_10208 [Cytospora chrysosperma]|uniref:Reverse transcriptase domain-containing protein n=1 Tax=Cytospora chrysosperma TaxID=252740 RepID=A0A423V7I7_CYTCH|nr:hypothetical protein VSDG_10208 [Valsa sordida]